MDMTEKTSRNAEEADIRLGRRVRALRLERKLSLAELAARAGISIGALSQIERGMNSLRVRVLWALAAALEVEPSSLIVEDAEAENDLYCVRLAKRRPLPVQSEGITKDLLSPPGAALTGMLVTVLPGGGTDSYSHAGHEFGIVTAGEVELMVDSTRYLLRAGDSFAFKSTLLHAFHNIGAETCEILWVNTQKAREARDGE